MKIAICSSFVPFLYGGARNIVDWLKAMLVQAGHKVEKIYLPNLDDPDLLFQQMAAYRWIDLSAADRIICLRPPAYFIPHPHKILWFIHHFRIFYDLWDSPYRVFPDNAKYQGIRAALHAADTAALTEAKKIFTNSNIVTQRIKNFNGLASEVLYPPLYQAALFHCQSHNDEILCISRIEHHKRQHLLIEAMHYTRTNVKLRLCGLSSNPNYTETLNQQIEKFNLTKKVFFDHRWISEAEKIALLSTCLAVAYLPLNEDSYGYPSLEASHSTKAVLTTTDSGGVIELIQDGYNGLVTEPDPQALAAAMDQLYLDRAQTQQMGRNALQQIKTLNIHWDHVINRLLA